MKIKVTVLAAALGVAMAMPAAQAQIPVTDVASITQRAMESAQQLTQLLNQLEQMKAQLQTMRSQLDQAKDTYSSMTGSRGMGQLLGNENYERIPTNWQQTMDMTNGTGQDGNISSLANKILKTMGGIDPSVFSSVDQAYGQLAGDQAKQAASYQAVQGTEYDDVAKRFGDLKQLIGKIDQAPDQKAILDLNARIGAQQVMLQNEQLKMLALAQLRQAQQDAERIRTNKLRAEVGAKPWIDMGGQP
jgi:type IV secretion system protein VirB5